MSKSFTIRILTFAAVLGSLSLSGPLVSAEFDSPPAPSGYVLDEAEILSAATESQLQTELSTLDQETSTQIVVVTLTELQGYEPEQAALAIGRSWGVGQEGSDNGVVFLIAPQDRVARIEVGYGLEGAITDAQSYDILNSVALPRFAEGDYDQGTLDAVSALETLARGETFTLPEKSTDSGNTLWMILFYLLPFGWAFLSWLSNSKAWWVGGIFGGVFGFLFAGGWLGLGIGLVGGLLLDYVLSTYFYQKLGLKNGHSSWWYLGGGGRWGGGSGGGFGGFGGGSFGGGGASGRW